MRLEFPSEDSLELSSDLTPTPVPLEDPICSLLVLRVQAETQCGIRGGEAVQQQHPLPNTEGVQEKHRHVHPHLHWPS